LLPLFIILLGAVFILSAKFLEHLVWRADVAVTSWWARVTGLAAEQAEASLLFTDHFFAEIGLALMVSGLMAIFVEFIFRSREDQERNVHAREDEKRHLLHVAEDQERHQRQMEELKTSVFHHVLGALAPPWLSDQVVDLYKGKVLREAVNVIYTFEPPPETIDQLAGHKLPSRDDLLKVTVDINYKLRNLTDGWARCEIAHGFSPTVPLPGATSGFVSLTVVRSKKPDEGDPRPAGLDWHEGERDECVNYEVPPDTDRLGWKSRSIIVNEKFEIGPKDTMDVHIRSRSLRWRYDHLTWVTRVPAEKLTVKAIVKDGVEALDVTLERSHPKPFIQTGKPAPGERSFLWESNGPLLPYQGFALHWFPPRDTGPAELGAGPSIPMGRTESEKHGLG
jgi:hypothetical protein